nr:VCBS repeat-containing protein [Terriglobales bacterium]
MKTRTFSAVLLWFAFTLAVTASAQQFIESLEHPAGGSADAVVTADFNGDGSTDLAIGNGTATPAISIQLGNGDGTFHPGQQITTSNRTAFRLVTGDWNSDGLPDLAALEGSSNNLDIYIGVGDGTFIIGQVDPTGQQSFALATGDLNNDGSADLVAVNPKGVTVFLGNGDGSFSSGVFYNIGSTDGSDVAVGDFNHDGKLDVVASFNRLVAVALGNGDGTLQASVGYFLDAQTDSVAVGDLNGDGVLDVIAGGVSRWALLLGSGDGTFGQPTIFQTIGEVFALAVADIDGDGHLDVVQSGTVGVWRNKGDGTFGVPQYYGAGSDPHGIATGDFNGDGRVDVVTANRGSSDASVLLNNGRGSLLSRRSFDASSGGLTAAITSIAVGYVDRDSNLDVAAVEDNSFNRVLLLPGNPDGSLRPAKAFGTGKFPRAVALADVDGDGLTDIVTANGANSISVLRGNGLGNFKPHVDYASGVVPYV